MKQFFCILLACCLCLFAAGCGEGPQLAAVGSPAPDFTLTDLKGRTWKLSDLKGRVVFINFWATWCPPCRQEMPSMQKVYEAMPEDDFVMLAILNNDAPAMAEIFAGKLGITFPIPVDQNNTAGSRYGLTGVPETFIVDKQGILREKFIGPAEWDSPPFMQMLMQYAKE